MMPSGKFYVIYYGWLIDDADGTPNQEAHLIAQAKPDAVIASFYTFEPKYDNLSVQVRELLNKAGIQLFAYVDTDYGNRPIADVQAEAIDYLANGIDGIFYDQVYNFLDDAYTSYYQELYNLVRASNKTVIVNTGIAQPGEPIMEITDILMVEHAWRSLYKTNPWFAAYPPTRFMGNSSNEPDPEQHFDYLVDGDTGIRDAREAWANGIGWHCSTDRYITLPPWFLACARRIGESFDEDE
jgi:hypothetical protein